MSEESLIQAWRRTVARAPDARALIDGATGRVWTRAELAAAAETWAAQAPVSQTLAGRRVVMAEPNGARWFEVFLGLLHLSAIPAPADATEPVESLERIAHAIGAGAFWHEGRLQPSGSGHRTRRPELCLIKLTSGSTGTPRARTFTHAQMLADGRQVCASMGIQPMDLNLAVIPLGHSYGLGNLVVPLLDQGTAMLCCASPLPHVLAADCARWQPTVFPAVPTLLRALVRVGVEPPMLGSLRLVISAGAQLGSDIAAEFAARFGRLIHSFYGSSETGGITFDRSGEAAMTGRSVGAPLEGVNVHFRAGGRFTVESAAVMGCGRFSPPDRAALTPGGELQLLGRVGRAVKIAGRRLDLGEVERTMLAIPGVRGAFVTPHPLRPDALAAVAAGDVDTTTLRTALATVMAAWKVPDRIVVVPELPITERGKPDRASMKLLLSR